MKLTAEEQAVLRGERGAATRFCLDLLCRLGELYGAPDLVPITQAHIDANLYVHEAGLDFALHVRRLGARVSVPTTLNVTGRDAAAWRAFKVPEAWAERCAQMDAAYVEMGAKPTFTCTPYLLESAPSFGQDVAWGESNAIAFVNSWIGARSERYADFVDLCAAVAGRVPRVGLHVPANRRAQLLVRLAGDVPAALRRHESLFPVLGYALGEVAGDRVAAVEGLPRETTRDQVKALCAAAASSGAVGLVHLVGVTPEAPTLEATGLPAGAPLEVLDLARLAGVRRQLGAGASEVDLVALGSPHLSYEEACEVERRLAGRAVHPRMALWLTTSRAVHALLAATGRLARLEAAGARVMRDACVIVQPVRQWGFRGLMTNSGKYAHYSAAHTGLPARLGSLADCVETAVRGEVVSSDDALWSGGAGDHARRVPGREAGGRQVPGAPAEAVSPRRSGGELAATGDQGRAGSDRDTPRGRVIGGRAEGVAVVSPEPISFWGDFDPATGRIANPGHPLAGRPVAGRVLVFPQGRGSSSAAQVLLEALRRGTAPAALVNVRTEPLLAVGPLVGRALYGRSLPVVALAGADFARIADGDRLVVDADAGTVTPGEPTGS